MELESDRTLTTSPTVSFNAPTGVGIGKYTVIEDIDEPLKHPMSRNRDAEPKDKIKEGCCNSAIETEKHSTDETNEETTNDVTGSELKNEEKEESATIRFSPPAYIQRYVKVREELYKRLLNSDQSPKSILEVGCAELSMHMHFKNLPKVQKIMYLDKDTALLNRVKHKIRPLAYESLIPRETPLTVEVFAGCITKSDIRIMASDPPLFAIIGIEILEHLDEEIELEFMVTLFEKYAPPVVILTTPNREFNSVLGLKFGEFRHWDHRFEMTRAEFFDWCTLVCQYCPRYTFTIEGICKGPAGSEEFGCLSQMAIFELKQDYVPITSLSSSAPSSSSPQSPTLFIIKNNDSVKSVDVSQGTDTDPVPKKKFKTDNLQLATSSAPAPEPTSDSVELSIDEFVELESKPVVILDPANYQSYNLVERVEYPWKPKPSLREQVMEEVEYYVSNVLLRYERLEEFWKNMETTTAVPLETLLRRCQSLTSSDASDISEKKLRSWLQESGHYQILGKAAKFSSIVVNIPTYDEYHGNISDTHSESDTPELNGPNHNANKGESEEEIWD